MKRRIAIIVTVAALLVTGAAATLNPGSADNAEARSNGSTWS
ncbi:MAG: hypothetical protein ACKVVT_06670 [Dehalococcoidia bacterium]